MTVPPQIRDMLDACRPDHDDLSAPEMAPLAQALAVDADLQTCRDQCQAMDRAIRDAMIDVPVPAGLADRILARLAAQTASPSADTLDFQRDNFHREPTVAASSTVDQTATERPIATGPGASPAVSGFRRGWLAAASVAMALIILVAGTGWWMFPASRAPVSADELVANGILWSEQAQAAADWNSLLAKAPPDHAASSQVQGRIEGWRSLATPYDSRAAAYAVRGPNGEAWLFVLRANAAFLPLNDRPQRLPATGGIAVAAWTEGPRLYVLVAHERIQRLEDFLTPRKLAYLPRRTHVPTLQTPKTVDNGGAA